VYIREAHASDEWPLGNIVCIKQHVCIEERVAAAKSFVADYEYDLPCFVDTMDNAFDATFSVWPERYYLIGADDKLLHKSMPSSEFGYAHNELEGAILSALAPPAPSPVDGAIAQLCVE